MHSEPVIHQSRIIGKIIGYSHNFCNKKLRDSQHMIPLFAHYLFIFNIFFVVKGVTLCVENWIIEHWCDKNLTDFQYASIGSQFKFIGTVKYYQQSLSCLPLSANKTKKENIRKKHLQFYQKTTDIYCKHLTFLRTRKKNWVLDYLNESKGVLPYKKIKYYSDLEASPEPGIFWENRILQFAQERNN